MTTTTLTDVRTVAVCVGDQDAARDYYVGTLGFEVRMDAQLPTMRWLTVAPAGASVSIALTARPATATATGAGPDTETGTDTGIRFGVRDAAAEHAALSSRGVAVGEMLRWPGVPAMFTLDDPDGNRFYVVEDMDGRHDQDEQDRGSAGRGGAR